MINIFIRSSRDPWKNGKRPQRWSCHWKPLFYAIQLLALFPQQTDFLANLKLQVAKTIFGIFTLVKLRMVGLSCWYQLSSF